MKIGLLLVGNVIYVNSVRHTKKSHTILNWSVKQLIKVLKYFWCFLTVKL